MVVLERSSRVIWERMVGAVRVGRDGGGWGRLVKGSEKTSEVGVEVLVVETGEAGR